ncbi:hypothetical protein RYX36_006943, partial [Vicia faba]
MVVITEIDVTNKTMLDARFTSFLEKDNSFLNPWSWDPKACEGETSSTKDKEFLFFHPESYFSYEIVDEKSWNPKTLKNESGTNAAKNFQYLSFYPEPYFTNEIIEEKRMCIGPVYIYWPFE